MRVMIAFILAAAAATSTQAQYRGEPTIGELLEAIDQDPAFDPHRARQLARRARRGGWLPTLRVGLRRGRQQDLSSQLDDTPDTRVSTDDDLVLEASLVFRLDRAAYGPDEVSLAREERSRAMVREERARMVIAAFFERRRLQLEQVRAGRADLASSVRIQELEALLDAFTSGAFSRIINGRRRRD